MKNFAVITDVRLALLRHTRISSQPFSRIKLSEIMQTGHDFQTISGIKPQSCSFTENEKETDSGTHFEKKLKFEISGLRPEVAAMLNRYTGNQVAALITDANGYSWLIYPLSRTVKRDLPGTPKGANVTEVLFSGKGLYESPVVQLNL